VTDNYFDKSDYAFYGPDGALTSYSDTASDFVKRCFEGVEDILEKAETGRSYAIFTDGVHGNALRYEPTFGIGMKTVVAVNQERDERRKDLSEKLENGLKELYASDKYAQYLKTMSQFPRYSSRNTMLIHMQCPGASRIAGAAKWKRDFKRHPKKGEKALYIYAPVKNDKEPETKMFEKIDPQTGAPMLDKDGKVIMEELTKLDTSGMSYRLVPVFDVSQTDGKPLPEIVNPLNGDVERYDALLDALRAVSPLPIEFEPMPEAQDGYCEFGKKIGIREGMSQRQTVAAIVHEIAHARLHDKDNIPEGEKAKSRAVKELEAESVAFAICEKYGVNSGDNSFGYLAEYAGHDPEMKQLKASLDTIQKEVGSLSHELDGHYAVALKKRGLDAEQAPEQPQKQPAGIKITSDTRKINHWVKGSGGDNITFVAKVFDDGSEYGIDNGRVSKLEIRKDNEIIISYERGWDNEPTNAEHKKIYQAVMKKLNGLDKVHTQEKAPEQTAAKSISQEHKNFQRLAELFPQIAKANLIISAWKAAGA